MVGPGVPEGVASLLKQREVKPVMQSIKEGQVRNERLVEIAKQMVILYDESEPVREFVNLMEAYQKL